MKISKLVFYLYFVWGISTLLIMCTTGIEIVYNEWILLGLVNVFEIGFCVIAFVESITSLVCMFMKSVKKTDKLFLIPLLFCVPCLWMFIWNFA